MKLKTLQWNIGGGKIRDTNDVDGPYRFEGVEYIIEELFKHNPDIITLQETHQNTGYHQTKIIAERLGYRYFINDVYDESHIEKGQGLGQAILSKFPIINHSFSFFENPKLELITPQGEKWVSHNKGASRVLVQINNATILEVSTLHLVPFRRFNVDVLSDDFKKLRENIQSLISPTRGIYLLQGDFNFDNKSLAGLLDSFFNGNDIKEVEQNKSTTPKNRAYDHIVYKGIKHIASETVDTVLTDHYPIISLFDL